MRLHGVLMVTAVLLVAAARRDEPKKKDRPPLIYASVQWKASKDEIKSKAFALLQQKQIELLKSARMLAAALSKPELAALPVVRQQADPAAWLNSRLLVRFDKGDMNLRIMVPAGKPHEQALLANVLAEIYVKELTASMRTKKRQVQRLNQMTARLREESQTDERTDHTSAQEGEI